MSELAIICPTRARPGRCAAMVQSALQTTKSDVLIYVDRDDPSMGKILDLSDSRVRILVGEPIGRGPACNELCKQATEYRAYCLVSDDVVFVRSGWDDEIMSAMNAFGDDIGCVHLQSENEKPWANWNTVSRKWIDVLGWYNYPKCKTYAQDTIIQSLSVALGRITMIKPQVIKHECLPQEQREVDDRKHSQATTEQMLIHDTYQFLVYMADQFESDLNKLKGAMSHGKLRTSTHLSYARKT